jgi:hypothetical protein
MIVARLVPSYAISASMGADGNSVAWRVNVVTGDVTLCRPLVLGGQLSFRCPN